MIDRLEDTLARFWQALSARISSRGLSALLLLGTGTVLAIALWLEPSASGHSTHTQLGLGQCSFLVWTGYPCPMCGATTTFTLMAHLRLVEGLVNQPFAALLFMMTTAVFGISLAEVVRPAGRWGRLLDRLEPWEGLLATLFLGAMAAAWAYKAAIMRWP